MMESRTELMARLEREIAEHEERALRERVEARGKRVQLDELRSGLREPTALEDLTFSDAVVEVLRQEGKPLGPTDIHERLVAAGRNDQPQSVGGILQALKRSGRVERVARGQWAAVL